MERQAVFDTHLSKKGSKKQSTVGPAVRDISSTYQSSIKCHKAATELAFCVGLKIK